MTRLLPVVLSIFLFAPLVSAAEERATHPDGTLALRVPLNAKGERQGILNAYYPGGKTLKERARYFNGQLQGVREEYDEKGKLIGEQAWVDGRLVAPKSPRLIEANRIRIQKESAASVAHSFKDGRPTNSNAPSIQALASGLGRLNSYRYICDLPADVTLDDDYINLCQHAAELLVKVGELTHNPPRPDGVSDEVYALGKKGCGQSNLFVGGGDLAASVDAYMNDSDRSNIDRVGHRRWVLNPAMARTGFGAAGKFSAMYSFDNSRKNPADYDYICYPPRGYCPANLFGPNRAWHVSFNPAKYKITDAAAMTIYPVDVKLKRADKPLELNDQKVNRDGFGINNAIIARPSTLIMNANTLYEVVVTGVKTKDGEPAEISYFVSFYQ